MASVTHDFVASPGTSLDDFIQSGYGWTRLGNSAGDLTINPSGYLNGSGDKTTLYTIDYVPLTADYSVSAQVRVGGVIGSKVAEIIARCTDASNWYLWRIIQNNADVNFELYKSISGSPTLLGSYSGGSTTTGTVFALELSVNGTDIIGKVDGTDRVSVVDFSLTARGRGGVRNSNSSSNVQIGAFVITDIVVIPNITHYVDDTDLNFSPYTWNISGSNYALTANPGAYLEFKFTGTNCYVTIDGNNSYNAWVQIQIDDKPPTQVLINIGASYFLVSNSNLSDATHTCKITYFARGTYSNASWSGEQGLKITGFSVTGASPALIAITPKTKKAVFFGDSITEGLASGVGINNGTISSSYSGYAPRIAEALNSEYGQVGWGTQGWGYGGAGNIPTFINSWNFLYSGVSRDISSADYIFVNQGTNDSLNNNPPSTSTIQNWITSVRAVNPAAWIFVIVPFGQFIKSVIQTAVSNTADSKCVLIDLAVEGSVGLTGFSVGASVYSLDGIHPSAVNHGRLASLIIQQLIPLLGLGAGSNRSFSAIGQSYSYSF